MNLVTQIFASVAVLFHVLAFMLETVLFGKPAARSLLLGRREPDPGERLWAFNQGFYNLFLAAGPVAGMIVAAAGHESAGRALVVYSCAFMAACGLVLFASDRRLWRGALGQTVPPLVAVLAALV
jgi:putative membrane protein